MTKYAAEFQMRMTPWRRSRYSLGGRPDVTMTRTWKEKRVSILLPIRKSHTNNYRLEMIVAAEFALEVFISGFAASYVPPESATSSQRAFMRLAKGT